MTWHLLTGLQPCIYSALRVQAKKEGPSSQLDESIGRHTSRGWSSCLDDPSVPRNICLNTSCSRTGRGGAGGGAMLSSPACPEFWEPSVGHCETVEQTIGRNGASLYKGSIPHRYWGHRAWKGNFPYCPACVASWGYIQLARWTFLASVGVAQSDDAKSFSTKSATAVSVA